MYRRLLTVIVLVFVMVVPERTLRTQDYGAGEDALQNYFTLMTIYTKWREGLFGSRKFHERELWMFLTDLIGKNIETEADFILVFPESVHEKKVICTFKYSRWLYFHGAVSGEELATVIKQDPDLLKKWWRSGRLVSVSGKVRKFRLGRDTYGDTVNLWLEKVVVHP